MLEKFENWVFSFATHARCDLLHNQPQSREHLWRSFQCLRLKPFITLFKGYLSVEDAYFVSL